MRVIILALGLILSGCGSNGGSSGGGGTPAPEDPSCKSIFSVWRSDTDSEEHNFTSMANEVILADHFYTASNGAECGYSTNPNHALTAQLLAGQTGDPYNYQVRMEATLLMVGTCATYHVNGSTGGGRYIGYITKSCQSIQICEDNVAGSLTNCKSFH